MCELKPSNKFWAWVLRRRNLKLLLVWRSVWQANTRHELTEACAILALPFGSHALSSGKPGASNLAIAEIVERLLADNLPALRCSVFSQWEVPVSHHDLGERGRATTTASYLAELLKKHPNLRGKKIILVAHPWHLPRAVWHLEAEGFKVLIPPGIEEIPWDSPGGTQNWVKGSFRWLAREVVSRWGCRLLGSRMGPYLFNLTFVRGKTLVKEWGDSRWL